MIVTTWDAPHFRTRGVALLRTAVAGLTADERQAVLYGNAARLYGYSDDAA